MRIKKGFTVFKHAISLCTLAAVEMEVTVARSTEDSVPSAAFEAKPGPAESSQGIIILPPAVANFLTILRDRL